MIASACGRCSVPSSIESSPHTRMSRPPSQGSISPRSWRGRGRLLEEQPLALPAFRAALSERFPAHDATALAYACRNHLALVQVPPRGLLGRSHQVTVDDGGGLARASRRRLTVPRRPRPPLPSRVRPGDGGRHRDVVPAHRDRSRPRSSGRARQAVEGPGRPHALGCRRRQPGRPGARPHRCGSSPSTTTCCSRTPIVDASSTPRPQPLCYPTGQLGRGHVLVDGYLRGSWRIADGRLGVLHLPLADDDLDATVAEATRLATFLHPDDPPAVFTTAV